MLAKRNCRPALVLTVLFACSASNALADHSVYESVLPSTVFIANRARSLGWGSGVVIDVANRLVITNQHVVGDSKDVLVFLPGYDRDGNLITDARVYDENVRRYFEGKRTNDQHIELLTSVTAHDARFDSLSESGIAAKGHVVAVWKQKDLVVLQLDRLPEEAQEVPLATRPIAPGDNVHSIGNSGVLEGSLWRYTHGTVRNLYYHPEDKIYYLEIDSPINHGDSGGPVVNDDGELVGIVKCGFNGDLVNGAIELREIRALLDRVYSAGRSADERSEGGN